MKKMNCHKLLVVLSILFSAGFHARSQVAEKKELLAEIGYHMPANRMPYLLVNTKTKIEKRFLPVVGVAFAVYLDRIPNLVSKGVTDATGKARIDLPSSLKNEWNTSAEHTFILRTDATKEFGEVTAEISITKAKLQIDTAAGSDTRSIRVSVLQLSNEEWLPAGGVECKVSVKRLGGELPVGEEETYTTDSTGEAIVEFQQAKLPGDTAGNILLVARVEENEHFGNLSAETKVPWGIASQVRPGFNERTLWATRDNAPVWLLFAAASIVIIVWGTIVFLIVQLFKIRRLGVARE